MTNVVTKLQDFGEFLFLHHQKLNKLSPCYHISKLYLNTFHAFDRISTHNNEQLHSSVITSTNMNEFFGNDISQINAERCSPEFNLAEIMIIS
jgi:hypothetical protein